MRYKTTALAAAVVAGLSLAVPSLAMAHGQGGQGMMGQRMPCPGMGGQGMMGPGMMMPQGSMGPGTGRGGMMGPWMGGQGMMAPHGMGQGGMMGPGFGKRVTKRTDLSVDDVRHFFEDRLAMRGNKRLKVGEVKEADKDTIVADIVTQDDSLAERFSVDRHTGRMTRAE